MPEKKPGRRANEQLPDAIEKQVLNVLEGLADAREKGLQEIYRAHPEHVETIRRILEVASDIHEQLDAQPPTVEVAPPDHIGPDTILEVLGEGGMGTVYLAEQQQPIARRVALKVIKLGMDTKRVLARFETERLALARMDHASIARVLDAGATENGRPYFTMEYVPGPPITSYCDTEHLGLRQRLVAFLKICAAVQHAHQKGIIHRDLKPSNVLVTVEDGVPVPKVIDFGLARATEQDETERSMFTQQGVVLGTPEYMSPEQAAESGHDIDTRTDVYALGVLLYQLLTGALPFDSAELRRAGEFEMRRRIREDEPKRPSTRITEAGRDSGEVAARRRLDASGLRGALRGDLDWITMKAIAKDRDQRYQSASELAADINRHLRYQPVLAGPPSLGYRAKKFLRRYRLQVAAAAAVLLSLLVGLVVSISQYVEARANETTATQTADFLVDLFRYASPTRSLGEDIPVGLLLQQGTERIRHELTDQPAVRARLLATFGQVYSWLGSDQKSLELLEEAVALQQRLRGADDRHLLRWQLDKSIGLFNLGRTVEAEELTDHILARTRRVHGPRHWLVATCLRLRGLRLHRQGRPGDAEPLLRQALSIQRELHDALSLELARTTSALGILLRTAGRHEEALPLLVEAMGHMDKAFPKGHPEATDIRFAVGSCRAALKQLESADKITQRAVDETKRMFGSNHPRFALALRKQAALLTRSGRYAGVLPSLHSAVEILDRYPNSLSSAWTLNDLAVALIRLGRTEEARASLVRTLVIHREVRPRNPLHHAVCLNNLARLELGAGNLAEAEKHARDSLAMIEQFSPADAQAAVAPRRQLGLVLIERGNLAEAEKHLRKAVKRAERGPDRWYYGGALQDLAYWHARRGQGKEAEAAATQALQVLREARSGDHEAVAQVLYAIGWACALQKQLDRAEPYLRQSIECYRRLFPNGHAAMAWPLSYLGFLLLEERAEAAVPILKEAVALRRKVLAPDSYWMLVTIANLATAYSQTKRYQDAEPLLLETHRTMQKRRPKGHAARLRSLENLIGLYERWGKADQVRCFKDLLAAEQKRQGRPGKDV